MASLQMQVVGMVKDLKSAHINIVTDLASRTTDTGGDSIDVQIF